MVEATEFGMAEEERTAGTHEQGAKASRQPLARAGRAGRTAAALLIAGFRPGHSFTDIEARLAAAPRRDQVALTVAVLTLLTVAAVGAAQFGLIGLLVFWMAVILIAR